MRVVPRKLVFRPEGVFGTFRGVIFLVNFPEKE